MAGQSPELSLMMRAAEKAAKSLVRDFGEVEQLQVSQKGPGDFVSAADRRAEEIIHAELSKARPGYGFLMEEGGEIKGTDENKRWIIDPLDGTTNFLHGIPHWCISIGLEVNGEMHAGVVHDPIKNEMFFAERNGGAFMSRKRLRVSGRRELMASTIATGAPRRSVASRNKFVAEYAAMQESAPGLRRFGAAALDLAYVAAGRYEGFWERDLKAWDIAAGIVLVREAGGFVSDIDNEKASPIVTGCVLAANGHVFKELRAVLLNAK